MVKLGVFRDQEIKALSMNNYFSINKANKSFRNLIKFFKGLASRHK